MSKIFISYRSDDSPGYLGRLRETLERRVRSGDIFMSSRDIPGGAHFPSALQSAVASSKALIVLIGPYWLAPPGGAPHDLEAEDDFVRLEIATAIDKGIKIIPVTVGGAPVPETRDVPSALRPFLKRQAIPLSEATWAADCDRVLHALGVGRSPTLAVALAVLAIAATVGWLVMGSRVSVGPSSRMLSVDADRLVIVETPGNIERPIVEPVAVTIRPEETVVIEIREQNPLLFTYSTGVDARESASYADARALLDSLGELLASLPASAGSELRPLTVKGIGLDRLREDLEMLRLLSKSLGTDLAASLGGPPQVEALKRKYGDASIETLAGRLENAFTALGGIAKACMAGPLLTTDDGAPIRCDGPAAIALNVALTAKATAYSAKKAAGDGQGAEALRRELENDRESLASVLRPTLMEFVAGLLASEGAIHRQVETLRAVSADVLDLHTPLRVLTAPYNENQQSLTVLIGAASKYDRFLDAEARRRRDARLRKLTFVLMPS